MVKFDTHPTPAAMHIDIGSTADQDDQNSYSLLHFIERSDTTGLLACGNKMSISFVDTLE